MQTDYKYPWGNAEPNEPYNGLIFTDEEWAEEPAELRALGRVAGERAWIEWVEESMREIEREIEARHATMTDEEIAEEEQQARDELDEIISASLERDGIRSGRRSGRGFGRG